jgi:hypothetical protein
MHSFLRRCAAISLAAVSLGTMMLQPLPVAAAGLTGPAFYVNGTLYRTVGTPTDFSTTGAPDRSYDTIYNFFGAQTYNVATAAPGMPGFNGGRWEVHKIVFADYASALAAHDTNGSGDFDSAAEVTAALADGTATDAGIVRRFECTVNRLPA